MLIDPSVEQQISWRDKLVGHPSKTVSSEEEKEDCDFLEGDIQKSLVNVNEVYNLWKLSAPFHLMDVENGYFLVKFQNKIDCEKVLSEGYLYKHKILIEIEGLVGKVAKLNMNTYSRARDHFARMVVYVNLDRPLVSQILINGKAQRVCFHCGRYGHVKGSCTFRVPEPNAGKEPTPSEVAPENHSILVDGQEE
ncbi:hypothetical protein Goari_014561 [Gossypium aridum]|uniref:CCHC-type domain-containing protein n=1 Tax=Gossypium aridum TaxID=34290 RepID=A0A7J8XI72_GOSAI|nr:hypothetical protein [Gossypium aridum]